MTQEWSIAVTGARASLATALLGMQMRAKKAEERLFEAREMLRGDGEGTDVLRAVLEAASEISSMYQVSLSVSSSAKKVALMQLLDEALANEGKLGVEGIERLTKLAKGIEG